MLASFNFCLGEQCHTSKVTFQFLHSFLQKSCKVAATDLGRIKVQNPSGVLQHVAFPHEDLGFHAWLPSDREKRPAPKAEGCILVAQIKCSVNRLPITHLFWKTTGKISLPQTQDQGAFFTTRKRQR